MKKLAEARRQSRRRNAKGQPHHRRARLRRAAAALLIAVALALHHRRNRLEREEHRGAQRRAEITQREVGATVGGAGLGHHKTEASRHPGENIEAKVLPLEHLHPALIETGIEDVEVGAEADHHQEDDFV